MKKILILIIITFPFFIFAESKKQETLNMVTWADYIRPNVIAQFEKDTGIKVNVDYIDNHYSLEAKIMATSHDYDITIPTLAPFFIRQVQFGLFQKLDFKKFKNYHDFDSTVINFLKAANHTDEYAIPFMIDTIGLGYDRKKILEIMPDAPVDSLQLIFDPKIIKNFAKCGIEILDSSEEIFALALLYLGLDPNSESEKDLNQAANLLAKIRPYVSSISSSLYYNNLGSGDTCLTLGYSGDVLHAKHISEKSGKNLDITYILPKEGSLMIIDLLAIPTNAPNKENAYKFINYVMDPKINAEIANYIGFTSPNLASFPLI